ncbi:MAG: hypothetical protein ACI9O0_000174 [Paracoccaceae bacterium]|jgi:hypothetical protein
MLEYLPKELRDEMALGRRREVKKKSRLRVELGGESFTVLRLWGDGIALEPAQLTHLRGLADIYDGGRHIFQALIVASSVENDELICSFKRLNSVNEKAPVDFWRDENAPVAYLTKG